MMSAQLSFPSRLVGLATAAALLAASLAAPVSAMPLASGGFGAQSDVLSVQLQKPPVGGKPGVKPGVGVKPGPGGGHLGGGPGNPHVGGGGGSWRNGAWVPFAIGLGVLGAAAAASTSGAPPRPGMCWYYNDPTRTAGHWDNC
jgi:hypothetical protein